MRKKNLILFALLAITSGFLVAQNIQPEIASGLPVANFSAFDTALCARGSVTFTDLSTNSPTSWKWTFTGGTPDTSTLQAPPFINYNTPGDYPVKLMVKNASGSDSITKTNYIHVYSSPSANFSGATNLCKGSTTIICATGGTQYHWSTGDTTSCIDVKPNYSITYTVQIRNGACFKDTTFTIIVDTMPVVKFSGDTTICIGQSTTIYAHGGLTYSWSTGATNDSIHVTYSNPGLYTYYVTITNGACSIDSSMVTEEVTYCAGIENYSNPQGMDIFPNPVNMVLAVTTETPLTMEGLITITDITGRQIISKIIHTDQQGLILDVSSLAPAIYLLKLQTNQGMMVRKFIKD